LRWEVEQADTTHAGPLDREVDQAGAARGEERLQRAITLQVESVQRDGLHARIMALHERDPRRRAWLASGRGSRQWVTSFPTERLDLEGHGGQVFREVITTYLGRQSPVSRPLVAQGLAFA